jgi:hypothetical protein
MRKPSGKIKMINAGDNAKLKIDELTGVKFAIVAPGSQLSDKHGE